MWINTRDTLQYRSTKKTKPQRIHSSHEKEAIKKHGQAVSEGHSLTARIGCVRVRTHVNMDINDAIDGYQYVSKQEII